MGQLFEALVEYLTEEEWHYHVVEAETAVLMSFGGRAGSWQCFAKIDEERGWFTFYSLLPSNVPEPKRAEVAEFITRANYGLVIGNFEMDYDDGEVRYRTSVDADGEELSLKLIENLVGANVLTMDRYFPGLMRVLYADCDPTEALAEIEEGAHEPDDEDLDEMDFGGAEGADDEEGNGFTDEGPEEGFKPPDDPV